MERTKADVSLGCYRGPLDRVLAGIDGAGLAGATLALSGDAPSELEAFVEERSRLHPELGEPNRRARGRKVLGITWSEGPLRFPIEGTNVQDLIAMLERYADPEIAYELEVEDAGGALISAPDVGDNEIWVSGQLSTDSRQALIEALGDGLGPTGFSNEQHAR